MSCRLALIDRLLKPTHGSRVALRDPPAVYVHEPEIGLSGGVALVGSLSKPTRGSRKVPRDTLAV
jgi:hypothetical protein